MGRMAGGLVTRQQVPLIDIDRAQVARHPDGSVTIDDPGSPWLIHVTVSEADGRVCIGQLRVDSRDGLCITSARLGRLPTAQILQVAAAEVLGEGHDNEMYYRMLARPRGRGERSWGPEHYRRVLAVHDWAVRTGRPGGGPQAVAELWGVVKCPTVWRWLARARRQEGQS